MQLKVKNQYSGFKVMTQIYDLLHSAKVHWNDVVNIKIEGDYVIVEFTKNEAEK